MVKRVKMFGKERILNYVLVLKKQKDYSINQNSLIKYDKPVYLGTCILDISKLLMYEFHYDIIKQKYGDKAKLLFTDTDSLCYEIETEDVYADMHEMKD